MRTGEPDMYATSGHAVSSTPRLQQGGPDHGVANNVHKPRTSTEQALNKAHGFTIWPYTLYHTLPRQVNREVWLPPIQDIREQSGRARSG
eukprot:79925-Amphidinium_carterae.2